MKKRSATTQPLTRRVLSAIALAYDEWNDTVTLPWLVRYNMLFPECVERELTLARRERRIREAFRKLQKHQFVEIRKIGSKMAIFLTDKGKGAALLDMIKRGKKRTDGYVLLVSFDIPEHERRLRNHFRHKLRSVGFKRLHKSLWITDKDVLEPLKKYLDGLGAKSWIRLFEARAISKK